MERLRRAWLVFLILVDPGRTRLRYDDKTSDDRNNESPAGTLAPIVGRDVQIHLEEPDQAVDAPPASSGAKSTPSQKRGVQLRQDRKRKFTSEIRPSNGSKKVWLGSYNTPQEAAAAYDVGIFYFKKQIPYNFADSHSFLCNLPPSADTSEGFPLGPQEFRKTVQWRAKLAAARVRRGQGKSISAIQPASQQNDDHSNKFLEREVLDEHNSTISSLAVVPNSNASAGSASTCRSLSTGSANIPAAESPTRSDGVDIVERYWKEHDLGVIDSSIHGPGEGRPDSPNFECLCTRDHASFTCSLSILTPFITNEIMNVRSLATDCGNRPTS